MIAAVFSPVYFYIVIFFKVKSFDLYENNKIQHL